MECPFRLFEGRRPGPKRALGRKVAARALGRKVASANADPRGRLSGPGHEPGRRAGLYLRGSRAAAHHLRSPHFDKSYPTGSVPADVSVYKTAPRS